MNSFLEKTGFWLARYLLKELPDYKPSTRTDFKKLKASLRPGDIMLVEGNLRISTPIKYLTQSTWSHAAFYIGPTGDRGGSDDPDCFIEADLLKGVVTVPLSKYAGQHTRICRPVGLNEKELEDLVSFMTRHIGMTYDLKNAIDLLRYLFPQPPVPVRWRRRLLALGSGDPTRAICSTLIAEAFEAINYPILPLVFQSDKEDGTIREIMHIRHHSLFVPRDFDISPYLQVVKPTLECGFDFRAIEWGKVQEPLKTDS